VSLPAVTLPVGKYVLVANFLIFAEATGFTNAHAVADFSSDDLPDAWKQSTDPFKDVDRKDFGFIVTLNAAAPGASGEAKQDKPRIKLAKKSPRAPGTAREATRSITARMPTPAVTR
jgi:hypothetical protein